MTERGGRITVEEHTTTIGTKTLYYEVCGAGEPMILLHGLSGSTRWWVKNVPFLAQSYRVYMVDLVGFGRARGQAFALKEAAALIAEWMQRLGLHPVHLIGHSMGGTIAVELAANYSERVADLVLVDALVLPIGRPLWLNALALLQTARFMSLDFIPVLMTDALRAGPVTLVKAAFEAMAADRQQDLEKVNAPALIVWGENDTLFFPRLGHELNKALPGSRLEIIREAGHNPMWDRPEQFNQAVHRFLRRRADPPDRSINEGLEGV